MKGSSTPKLYFRKQSNASVRSPFIPESFDNVATKLARERMRVHRRVEDKLMEMELDNLFLC